MNGQLYVEQQTFQTKYLPRETAEYAVEGRSLSDIRPGYTTNSMAEIIFQKVSLLDDHFEMLVPGNFQRVPPEKSYRSGVVPDVILIDDSGAVRTTISHLTKRVYCDTDLVEYYNEVRQILKIMNPSIEWLQGSIKNVHGKQVAFFEFISPILNMGIYNLSFFVELQQRVLTGNLVCPDWKLREWKPVFYQMLESVKITPREVRCSS